jgi:hypothetical protein
MRGSDTPSQLDYTIQNSIDRREDNLSDKTDIGAGYFDHTLLKCKPQKLGAKPTRMPIGNPLMALLLSKSGKGF